MDTELILIEPELDIIVKQSGLQKGDEHAIMFAPFMKNVAELSEKLPTLNKDNPSVIDAKIARECRLALVKNRTATGKQKDISKSTLLAEGNLIQALHNVIVNKSILVEQDYEAIEKHAEIKEAARKEALKLHRIELLQPYSLDLAAYDLGAMADDVFNNLLEGQRLLKEQREADAAKLEAERIEREAAEAKERERIRVENEKLKAENEAKELQLKEAADKLAIEQQAAKDEADRIAKINADKLAAIEKANQIARDKAKAESDRIAKELQDKKDADAKIEADRLAKEKADKIVADKLAKAPVKKQLEAWIAAMDLPAIPVDNQTANDIATKFAGWKQWALQQIQAL